MIHINKLIWPTDGVEDRTCEMTRELCYASHLTVQARVADIAYDADYEGREGPCEVEWENVRVFVQNYQGPRIEITEQHKKDCKENKPATATDLMDDVSTTLWYMEKDVLEQESNRAAA